MAAKCGVNSVSRQASPITAQQPAHVIDVSGDRDDSPGSLRALAGSTSRSLNNVLANQALHVLWLPPGTPPEQKEDRYKAALAAMMEFKPQDGIEGMLAVQGLALHSASVECMRRAMIPEQSSEAAGQLRRQGASLSRAFLEVVAALDRKRGKGMRQVVRVERVMVGAGGQAVVGNVHAGAPARHTKEG